MDQFWIFCAQYLLFVLGPILLVVLIQSSPADRRVLFIHGAITLIIGIALAKGSGYLIAEDRPFVVLHRAPLIPHLADSGFPSDHTLLAFAIAFLIWPFRARIAFGAMLVAVLVAFGRVECFLHSWLDVGASFGFAAIAGSVARLVRRQHS